jgi:DNA-binding transcriptional regulator YhcF (GntR family)
MGICIYASYTHAQQTRALAIRRPRYLQIIEQIRRRIAVGDLKPFATHDGEAPSSLPTLAREAAEPRS